MRTPFMPLDLMVKATKTRLTQDEQNELTAYIRKLHNVANYNEGLVYSLTHQHEQLQAENRFLVKLINVKLEEP